MTRLGLSKEDHDKLLKTKTLCLQATNSLKTYSDRLNVEKTKILKSLEKLKSL